MRLHHYNRALTVEQYAKADCWRMSQPLQEKEAKQAPRLRRLSSTVLFLKMFMKKTNTLVDYSIMPIVKPGSNALSF